MLAFRGILKTPFFLDRGDFRKRRERTRLTVPTIKGTSKSERLRNRLVELFFRFLIFQKKLINWSSECNVATKGALYFNEQQKELYECDGQIWLKKSEQKCPTGWLEHKNVCYQMSKTKKNWSTAKNICELEEATLTFVKSKRLARILAKENRRKRFWVGYYKPTDSVSWKWLTNETFEVNTGARDLRSTRDSNCMLGPAGGLYFDVIFINTQLIPHDKVDRSGSFSKADCNAREYFVCSKPHVQ